MFLSPALFLRVVSSGSGMEPVPSSLQGERPHLELYPQPCNFNPFPLHPTVCLSLLYSLAGADSVPSQRTYAFTVVQRPPTLWGLFCLALSAGALCSLVLLEEWASPCLSSSTERRDSLLRAPLYCVLWCPCCCGACSLPARCLLISS